MVILISSLISYIYVFRNKLYEETWLNLLIYSGSANFVSIYFYTFPISRVHNISHVGTPTDLPIMKKFSVQFSLTYVDVFVATINQRIDDAGVREHYRQPSPFRESVERFKDLRYTPGDYRVKKFYAKLWDDLLVDIVEAGFNGKPRYVFGLESS